MTETWADATVRRVALEVKRLRKEVHGMSVAKLAERTKELGHPISVNTITDLELGRRSRLDVTEILVLASCLEVPPADLLFPSDEPVFEALPGRPLRAPDAKRWLVGYPPLFGFPALRQAPEFVERTKAQFDEADARTALARAQVRLDNLLGTYAPDEEIDEAQKIVEARAIELDNTIRRSQ